MFFAFVLLWHRRIWIGSLHPAVSQMLSLWGAFFVACYLHVAIVLEKQWIDGDSRAVDYYGSYPSFCLFSGFLFSALGRQYWGGCCILGAMFFVMALLIPWLHQWSPLLFGLSWSAALAVISWRLRRLRPPDLSP